MMPVSPPPRTRISRYRSTTSGGQLPASTELHGGPELAVRCHSVRKVYRSPWRRRTDPVVALDRVDLEIARGECFGVLGPNGAGKTTFVEILEGIIAPSSGEVQVLGRTWSRDARDLRQRIGVCLQETRLPDRSSVGACLALFASLYPSPRPVDELLAAVALAGEKDVLVSKLSGGQRQRLAIACAMVGVPEILFLDEPTIGLDPQSRGPIWDLLRSFTASGGTLVLTTHSMEEAERLCDRVAMMDRGRIARTGRPAELIAAIGGAHVVELEMNGGVLDAASLSRLPGVTGVRESGGTGRVRRWALVTSDPSATLPALVAAAERSAGVVSHLAARRTTLEDVFVSLTGRPLHDA